MINFWNNLNLLTLLSIAAASFLNVGCDENPISEDSLRTKISDEQLLDSVQYHTFQYFWDGAEPNSGMARERIHMDGIYPDNDQDIVATGGTGMGMTGILGAIERDWITRDEARLRFEKMVGFLEKADRWNGIWPHWLDGKTGKVKPFSPKDDGADLVESAFLIQGLLVVREYFKSGTVEEKLLANRIDLLWREMDWNFHTKEGQRVLYWHWSPNFAWEMNLPIDGYNEALIVYILAAASPTYPIDPAVYHQGWAGNGEIKAIGLAPYNLPLQLKHNGAAEYGGPLFWAHYSYLSLDPRGLKDRYADYWEENRNQTLINRAWCIQNPGNFKGYGIDLWGLTSSYSINGYDAHRPGNDTGVISPTAAIASIVYTPQESMQVIRNLYENYFDKMYGSYGFYDAMSPHHDFYPRRYLAIDQGPIVTMIENHRSGLGWRLFMGAPEVKHGLQVLDFDGY
jgi:hypothetical protein